MNERDSTMAQSGALKPAARLNDLVTSEVADEVLVYDRQSHHIHHLNQTSAVIWRLCDGTRTVADLARSTGTKLGAEVDEGTVRVALAKLSDADLLDQPLAEGARGSVHSRRKLLRRAAVAGAIAVPAIVSMTAPNAAAAQSGVSCAATCTPGAPCSSCPCPTGEIFTGGICASVGDLCVGLCVAV